MENKTNKTEDTQKVKMQEDDDNEQLPTCEENTVATTQKNDPVMIDLENKIGIIYNVLKSCIDEQNENVYYYMDYIVSRLAYLTKLPKQVLSEIVDSAKDPKNTDELEESVLETPDIDISLRQTLIKHYVKCKKIPRSESLKSIVNEHCYNYQLHEQLKRSGYVWRRLPNTKRAIIVEHPKRVIHRQRYLQKIVNYRKERRRIVYIETKILNRADKHICQFQKYLNENVNFIVVIIVVANNNNRFLKQDILTSKSIFKCQKLIEDYITDNIIPDISEPSVVILEDKSFYKNSLPIPTIESEKSEMIEWLKINGLPHDEKFHRSELFELIQRCKIKGYLHKFDAFLYSRGHEILRRPPRTEYLNYYKPLWENASPITEDFSTFLIKKSQNFWRNLEFFVICSEKSVITEDLAMENVTDNMLTMANNIDVSEWANAECDEEEDSLVQEEFIIEMKNLISPEELEVRERKILSQIEKIERILLNKPIRK